MRIRSLLVLMFLACRPLMAGEAPATESPEHFVRLVRDEQQRPQQLQTVIVQMAAVPAAKGLTVDLIGAVHIADEAYYDELNRRFRNYDAVLYELVAPAEANVPRAGEGTGSAVGGLQMGMKELLELEYQLDGIDYRAANFVHADMSPEEFAQAMKARNESFVGMAFKIAGWSFGEQAKDPLGVGNIRLLSAMMAKDRALQLKLIMAEQFATSNDAMALFDGPEGSAILTERNKRALDVLRREIQGGKKRLAIFYGAGHLPDLQRKLETEFGMKRVATQWLTAWSLKPSDD